MSKFAECVYGPRCGTLEPAGSLHLTWVCLPASPTRKHNEGVNCIYLWRFGRWVFAGYVKDHEFASEAASRCLKEAFERRTPA